MIRKFMVLALALAMLPALRTLAQTDAGDDIVLKNSGVELRFSGSDNGFSFKEFRVGDVEVLPDGGSSAHPWELTYLGPNGETPVLQPKYTYYKGGRLEEKNGIPTAVFTWNVVLEGSQWPVNVYVSLPADAEMPRWSIDAAVPDKWVVTKADFPRITVRRLSGAAKGILPFGYGAEYDMPTETQLQMRYPSVTGVMQMVLMHNETSTVYFAAEDTTASGKYLTMKGEGHNVLFTQSSVASYAWSDGGRFSLPWETVIGYNPDTWQNTVTRWYRPFTYGTKWGGNTLSQRKITNWIQNADMWLRPADATPEMMESVRKALAYFGKGVGLHWYYWHDHPFDTNYPEYFPAQPGFKDMIRESQRLGAYVTPYINGRLWDTANHTYGELGGSGASCRKPDGTLYTEVYSSKVLNTVTCPSSQIWRDVLTTLNRRILKELGTDGVYMDQIGCAASEPCYAGNHDHARGGGGWWPEAYRSMLTDMRRDIYGKNDAMTTEENVECYIDLFDMMLVVNSPHSSYMKMVPLFPLVYSDRCVYSGFTYIPWKLNDGSFLYITMKSLLWGSQLGWVNPEWIMRPENGTEAAFLRTLAQFRKGQHDIFLGGRFISEFIPSGDNPAISIPNYQDTNVVVGAEWKTVSGEDVYLLANMSCADRTVILPDGRTVTVSAYDALRINK